jgi:flagellar protein FlaJ
MEVDRELPYKLDIWSASHRLLGGLANRVIKYFKDLRISLLKSRLKVSLDAYVSFILLVSLLTLMISAISTSILFYFFYGYPLLFSIVVAIPLSVLLSAIAFAITYSYPSIKANLYGARIDDDLPYAIAHMNVLATAGATPERIIRSVASIPDDSVAEFMSDIVRDIDFLGMDLVTALRNAKERAPTKILEDFISEMEILISSGGNLQEFLISYGRSILGTKAIQAKEFSETLATMAEVFVIMMVVFPLLLIIMFSIMSLVGGQLMGFSIPDLMFLITYLMVPMLGIVFLVILDQVMPRGD